MGKHKRHNKHHDDRNKCDCGGSGNDCQCHKRLGQFHAESKCSEPKFWCDYNNTDFGLCWKDTSSCRRYWNYEQPCYGLETEPIKCHKRRHA